MPQPDPAGPARPLSLQAAQAFRYILAGLFAILFFNGAPSDSRLPFGPQKAHADISAAPGYLCATMRSNNKFYLIDTNEKKICVYALHNEGLRLVSARKFTQDEQIFDGSMKGPIPIEGRNGVTVAETEAYLKNTKADVDAIKKKIGKD
jgi:hypothetical protein